MNHVPQSSQFTCPCCKGFIGEAAPIDAVIDAENSPVAKRILRALSNPVGSRVPTKDIIKKVWPVDRPSDPSQSLRVAMCNLRKRLQLYGWSLVTDRSRGITEYGGSFYRLIPAEVSA